MPASSALGGGSTWSFVVKHDDEMDVIETELGALGLGYVVGRLNGGLSLSRQFLNAWRPDSGRVFAWLPTNIVPSEELLRDGGLRCAAESRQATLTLVRDFLTSHTDGALWVEEPSPKRSDPFWQLPDQQGTGWFFGEEVYSLGFATDDDKSLQRVLSNSWQWEGWGGGAFISSAAATAYRQQRDLRIDDLVRAAEGTRFVLCGAFDGESYVIWRHGDL